jgi:two-component system, LytTR family, response regulator
MTRAILIDDDSINISLLSGLLKTYCSTIHIVATATNMNDAIRVVMEHKPDLLFLDVEIHDKTGFDILSSIERNDIYVILITAFDRYAISAIKHEVDDYLLKPVKIDELIQAVKKGTEKINERRNNTGETDTQKINSLAIHHKTVIEFIPFDDIIHIEASGSYSNIHTMSSTILSSRPLKDIETQLPLFDFLRIHHSHVINKSKIAKLSKGKLMTIFMANGNELPVSDTKKKELSDFLGF